LAKTNMRKMKSYFAGKTIEEAIGANVLMSS